MTALLVFSRLVAVVLFYNDVHHPRIRDRRQPQSDSSATVHTL